MANSYMCSMHYTCYSDFYMVSRKQPNFNLLNYSKLNDYWAETNLGPYIILNVSSTYEQMLFDKVNMVEAVNIPLNRTFSPPHKLEL